jgi:hypothetical protein
MYGDYIHKATPDGKLVWEWHACHDMESRNIRSARGQHRDEFAPPARAAIFRAYRYDVDSLQTRNRVKSSYN